MSTVSLFARIDALRERLKATPLTGEQREKLDKKMRLEFHYNTNHIEGNTLTYGETVQLFLHDEIRGAHTSREIDEMKASEVALRMVEDLAADLEHPLTESFIKDLNRVLLKEPFWKEAITSDGQPTRRLIDIGEYKKFPNNVRTQTGEIFQYASPQETPIQMGELMEWYRKELVDEQLHPVAMAAMLHYRFVRIHPFDDGNGRLSRLLMNYILLYLGYPPVVIKSVDKKSYLNALHDADAGNLESFITYIATQAEWSLHLALRAARGESLEDKDDWKKELDIFKRQLSKEDSLEITKNESVVLQCIGERIIPFRNRFSLSMSEYSDIFFRLYDYYKGVSARAFTDWIFSEDEIRKNFISCFDYHFAFKEFKRNGLNVFNIDIRIRWHFDKYQYKVIFQTDDEQYRTIAHYYHQDLTEAEKTEIISESGKWILAQIKRRIIES